MTTPTSIEDVELNPFHRLLVLRTNGGWLIDGYVLSIVGVSIVQMSDALKLDDFWQGMIGASAILGIFLGGFISLALADRLGRKKLYFVGPILFLVCSAAQLWVDSAWLIFLLRLLIGIGVSFEYSVAGVLLVEFLPQKYRGSRLAGLTTYWFVGAALAYIIGNLILIVGGDAAWRWVLASTSVFALALILVRLGTPESPRWLLSKQRIEEANVIIKKVFGHHFSVNNILEQKKEHEMSVRDMFRSGYGMRLLFVTVFWMCAVIPVFAVYAFAPKVLAALNLTGAWASWGSIAITVMFALGCVIASAIVELIGRRKLIIHSFLWSGLALLGLGLFADAPELVILGLFSAYGVLIGGAQVLELVYPNELFPTEIRPAAVALSASFSRIGAAVGTFLVPVALNVIGIANTMYAAAAVTFLGLLVSIWLAPETRGMTLDEAASLKH